MALTHDDEARGLKAYEQARAFERLRTWRLPLSFTICAVAPALTAVWMWSLGHPILAGTNLAIGLFLAWTGRIQWKHLQARYARNMRLLEQLKAEHGDALPWIQVEKHFADLEKLKQDLRSAARD